MSERTQALRELIYGQQPGDPFVVIKVMLDEIDTQAARIKGLEEDLVLKDRAMARMTRRMDRMQGIHGA